MEAIYLDEIIDAVDGKIIILGNTAKEKQTIKKVSTNSKDDLHDSLFVPIIGERVDAHNFIKDAFTNGAVIAFTSRHQSIEDVKNDVSLNDILDSDRYGHCILISVKNTLVALQQLASYYRDKFDLPVIGISGSVGKTTTKEMISAALETRFKVLKTFGNMNSQIGVALMMFELDHSYDLAVIEMGISEPDEMPSLVSIAKPKYAVLTNVGVSHIANLKTRENIRREKARIVERFEQDSVLFVNGCNDMLEGIINVAKLIEQHGLNADNLTIYHNYVSLANETYQAIARSKVCSFGTEEFCEYNATDVRTIGEQTKFNYISPDKTEEITLNVMGIHNVHNAIVALAIAQQFGIDPSVAKKGLYDYAPIKMRGQIFNVADVKVIDDTYNASPDSMKSGINVLLSLSEVTRRIAVLADVLELGEQSRECHLGVGEFLADQDVDVLITIGTEAKYIAEAVIKKNNTMRTYSFDSCDAANEFLSRFVCRGDGILVKGSRGMHTEQVVEMLKSRG